MIPSSDGSNPFADLSWRWRAAAGEWRDAGQDDGLPQAVRALYDELAAVVETCARELEDAVASWLNQQLTIDHDHSETSSR